ncbi:hypothetical protein PCE1_002811 [Barthelona sp. PCE]
MRDTGAPSIYFPFSENSLKFGLIGTTISDFVELQLILSTLYDFHCPVCISVPISALEQQPRELTESGVNIVAPLPNEFVTLLICERTISASPSLAKRTKMTDFTSFLDVRNACLNLEGYFFSDSSSFLFQWMEPLKFRLQLNCLFGIAVKLTDLKTTVGLDAFFKQEGDLDQLSIEIKRGSLILNYICGEFVAQILQQKIVIDTQNDPSNRVVQLLYKAAHVLEELNLPITLRRCFLTCNIQFRVSNISEDMKNAFIAIVRQLGTL